MNHTRDPAPLSPDLAAVEEAVRTAAATIMPRQEFLDVLDMRVRHRAALAQPAEPAATPTTTQLVAAPEAAQDALGGDLFVGGARQRGGRVRPVPPPPRTLGRRRFMVGAAVAAAATFFAVRGRPVESSVTEATRQAGRAFVSAQLVAAAQPTPPVATASPPDNLDFTDGLQWWGLWGNNPGAYAIAFDTAVRQRGAGSGSLASVVSDPSGFGTLSRSTAVGSFRGTRVRMTGTVKAAGVVDWAGLWLRVDGAGGQILSFDNMQGRPITGTRDWQEYEIVLDVPQDSTSIAFGVLLSGKGQVWLNGLRFDVLGSNVPTTDANTLPDRLRNLDFESGTAAWFLAGDQPHDYRIGGDTAVVHEGAASASLRSEGASHGGFGTLMQMVRPDGFAGTRVRMSAWVRAENVAEWAGLWLRVDGPDRGTSGQPLSFDNMQRRPITGTRDWTRYEIVLDVPTTAGAIAFGILLHGTGAVWLDDVTFATVGREVPTTG